MRRFAFVLWIALLVACSSGFAFAQSKSSDRQARIDAYNAVHPKVSFRLAYVPSSAFGNTISFGLLRSGAGTQASYELAKQLVAGLPPDRSLVVTGPDDQLAAETLIDALSRVQPGALARLNLVYVGAPGYEANIQAAAEHAGAKVGYIAYP